MRTEVAEDLFSIVLTLSNKASSTAKFIIKGVEGVVEMQLYNSFGGLALEQSFSVIPNENTFSINTKDLEKGKYFANFRQGILSKGIEIRVK